MGASRQGDIHFTHKARHSNCLTCGLMTLPGGRGGSGGEREGRGEGEKGGMTEGSGEGEGGMRRGRVRQGGHGTCFLTSFHSPVQNIL